MTVNNIKELQAIMKLCRKEGVDIIKIDGLEFHLKDKETIISDKKTFSMPAFKPSIEMQSAYIPGGITEDTQIITDQLSEEQMLFYSAGESPNQ